MEYFTLEGLFEIKGPGIIPGREELIMHFERPALEQKILMLTGTEEEAENLADVLDLEKERSWSYEEARRVLLASGEAIENFMASILVKPFEYRWIAYHEVLVESPQEEVMRPLLARDNLALLAGLDKERGVAVFFSTSLGTRDALTSETWYFPLKVLKDGNLVDNLGKEGEDILAKLGLSSLEEAFYYIYALGYAGALRRGSAGSAFKVPIVQDQQWIQRLVQYGSKLLCIHNLEEPCQIVKGVRFFGEGKRAVVSPTYDEREGILRINETQWFQPVSRDVWEYRIGDFQVLKDLLVSREGQKLDPYHFVMTITALGSTIALQKELKAVAQECLQPS